MVLDEQDSRRYCRKSTVKCLRLGIVGLSTTPKMERIHRRLSGILRAAQVVPPEQAGQSNRSPKRVLHFNNYYTPGWYLQYVRHFR